MIEILYYHWILLGVILVALEIFTPSFLFIWFGISAIITGILNFFFEFSLTVDLINFTCIAAALCFIWFIYLNPKILDKTKAGFSLEKILNQTGIAILTDPSNKKGIIRFTTAKLGSDEWQFTSIDDVAVGDRLIVSGISGNTLIVKSKNN